MKTNQLILLLFAYLFLLNSCEKANEQTGMVFLQNEWKVQSIVYENKRITLPSDAFFREDAYILKFRNDSLFYLPTSVNEAGGEYQIVSDGHIIISYYGEWTEVAAPPHQKIFNEQLVSVFNEAMSYSYTDNKLIFRGEQNKEIVFVKQ